MEFTYENTKRKQSPQSQKKVSSFGIYFHYLSKI
jgi:hypothetical protein